MAPIFLHKRFGRTLWVPSHVQEANETQPVEMLSKLTTSELSRSFYLFDEEVNVVPPSSRSSVPHSRTQQEVLDAVEAFRRRCKENNEHLLSSRYNPMKDSAPPSAAMATPSVPFNPAAVGLVNSVPSNLPQQGHPYGGMMPGYMAPDMGYGMAPPQSIGYPPPPMPGPPLHGSMHPNMFHPSDPYEAAMPPMGYPPQYLPGMAPYAGPPMNPRMRGFMRGGYPRGGASRGGGPPFGSTDFRGPAALHGPFNSPTPVSAEPIEHLMKGVEIPREVMAIYSNPAQRLVCATMPGARMTVWLREHEVPAQERGARSPFKYVFCKGGIVLMLKAKGSDIEKSKPVELFPKQICTHFLMHGYCSRSGCLHEHHTEEQLRELIAARHVQQKAMSKKQRHDLIAAILSQEADNLVKFAAERETRMREREANRGKHGGRGGSAASRRTGDGYETLRTDISSDDDKALEGPSNPAMSGKQRQLINVGVANDDEDGDSDSDSSSASSTGEGSGGQESHHHHQGFESGDEDNVKTSEGEETREEEQARQSEPPASVTEGEKDNTAEGTRKRRNSTDDREVEPEAKNLKHE